MFRAQAVRTPILRCLSVSHFYTLLSRITLADAHADINSATAHLFKEQFGWDILSLFDKWVDELAATRQRIRSLDELRHNTAAQDDTVKSLQAKAQRSTNFDARD